MRPSSVIVSFYNGHTTMAALDASVCSGTGGHLSMLRWQHEVGCPCDEGACAAAAERGCLDIHQLLPVRAQGCSWDGKVCAKALEEGHLELLQWARANGCPREGEVTSHAYTWLTAADGGVNMLSTAEWALANSCSASSVWCRSWVNSIWRRMTAAQARRHV
eukprot:TRINITY_DN2453_c0_g2_i1.p1 TRINITY_DN2453_c0_g2~~TRINITY_DN2453_c0_g2_i1.p1  ORF type:complete len:162 (-),score=1.18 TRINITY_DN2453_c0_g2_i1:105-590(-)